MPYLLLIDTSTPCCSVAIAENETVLNQQIKYDANEHASLLPNFIQACLQKQSITLNEVDAISISIGPGSYTGLRVGLSFAKALCYANQKPLITISTLEMMSYGIHQIVNGEKGLYMPMLDARRMEVYTASFNEKIDWKEKATPKIITQQFIDEIIETDKVFVAGPGAFKLKSFALKNNIQIIDDSICEAKYLAAPTNKLFHQKIFADVAYCEPIYLKQFGEVL